jgi:hypothetical protein
MRSEENIREIIRYFRKTEGDSLDINEEIIIESYQKRSSGTSNVIVKISSIIGGFLVAGAVLGFFFLTEMFTIKEAVVFWGIIFIGGAVFFSKNINHPMIDALTIPLYISGFFLIGVTPVMFEWNWNLIFLIFIAITIISMCVLTDYLLVFVSVLILAESVLALFLLNKMYDYLFIYNSFLAGAITLLFFSEAKWITQSVSLNKLYNPVWSGGMVSFLVGLFLTGKQGVIPLNEWVWLSSLVPAGAVLYLISKILKINHIESAGRRIVVYATSFLLMAVTACSPALSGALLIILLSFLVNYKSGIYLGVIAFVYFIIQYYYDLQFTLLVKSEILFFSGILFILFYLLSTRQKQRKV